MKLQNSCRTHLQPYMSWRISNMWGAHTSQTKMVSMFDSIGIHICELLTIDDTPSSKPTQWALKNWLLLWSFKIHAGHIFNHTWYLVRVVQQRVLEFDPLCNEGKIETARLSMSAETWEDLAVGWCLLDESVNHYIEGQILELLKYSGAWIEYMYLLGGVLYYFGPGKKPHCMKFAYYVSILG